MASVNSVFSFKVLAAITLAVLGVHMAALQASPTSLRPSRAEPPPRAFITRSIEPDMAPMAAPPSTHTAATEAPPPRPRVRPSTARSAPSPASAAPANQAHAGAPLEAPSEHLDAVSSRLEDATTPDRPEADQLALAAGAPRLPSDAPLRVAADKVPASVRLKYQVLSNKFPYRLGAELLWQPFGAQYEARLEIGAFGQARVQTSRGQITPQGLAPLRFSDKFRSEVAAHFNRAQGKVTFSANTPDAPLLTGAQDRLSVLVQLAAMLASTPERYPQTSTITIQTIGARSADTWLFTVGEAETLTLPGGQQATLKLLRNPREAFDQKVEVWLAPALGYLPARIRITEANGDYVDQQWLASEPLI
ncbi:MAG: DUF3108 domain-containing protein [Gammaproteobacteria bacterium]|uniref:DUF3108 domain-containing protein n=1 Tax=Rhodoferax sp. TaxID=50421 RepID=UPI00183B2CAC|nr:DUF3108 domain-containing protein [Rhodoferax sp.]MBU3900226.1 DUF3108 domain-containing protein [Gammaproteobacteria bacterium]MBA3057941.1 DUF3108 domain-containing protein [Rhodoferax sp.]MBU3997988.1 DUF3108 domain-containing protein [Gammaproteobacteria bacterium]MBU4079436.1 DUF3108 domain-containing protein [Gammaproteobacteria bacterium]MBU4114397.1 DUF3108 domain-containing protein [Gammaproteobacteria bacterium]